MVCLRHCSVDATKQVPRIVCVFYSPACKEVADTVKDEVMRQNHIEDDATAQKSLHYSSHTQTLTLQKKKGFSLLKKWYSQLFSLYKYKAKCGWKKYNMEKSKNNMKLKISFCKPVTALLKVCISYKGVSDLW